MMENQNKKANVSPGEVIIFTVLLVLLYFRWNILEDGDADNLICIINFIGMIIALIAFLRKLFLISKRKWVHRIGAGIILLVICCTILICLNLYFGRTNFSEMENDCITIAALLFSVPSNSIINFIYNIANK